MADMKCYCGHDCGRCLVRLATVTDDAALAAAYRKEAHTFYRDVMHMEIPPEKLVCHGGHADTVMEACSGCPFRKCCREREIERCRDCTEYPCDSILRYEKTWVNRFLQIPENQ
ncbi:MAG: DUF3795 domain-containing protein [Clostridia bacterium]|nr:DUF3795 domain-containing protein [Clostridia bacterium]